MKQVSRPSGDINVLAKQIVDLATQEKQPLKTGNSSNKSKAKIAGKKKT